MSPHAILNLYIENYLYIFFNIFFLDSFHALTFDREYGLSQTNFIGICKN